MRHLARKWLRRALFQLLRVDAQYRSWPAGPKIVAANHVSYLDGILLALSAPEPLVYAVDHDFCVGIYRRGLQLLAWLGCGSWVALDPNSPRGLLHLTRLTMNGQSICIFPQGGIHPEGSPLVFQAGLSYLVGKSGLQVVPMKIQGAGFSPFGRTQPTRIRPRIEITALDRVSTAAAAHSALA